MKATDLSISIQHAGGCWKELRIPYTHRNWYVPTKIFLYFRLSLINLLRYEFIVKKLKFSFISFYNPAVNKKIY